MTTIRYAAIVIFLIIVVALVLVLRDGFPVRRGAAPQEKSGPLLAEIAPRFGLAQVKAR